MEKGGYRPQLDVLRAIAIGLVLIEHFGGPIGREMFPLNAGALGVHLFFVLSGFLISRNFLSRLDRRPANEVVKHFYLTRVARLMPAYYMTLLVTFLFGVPEVRDYILWHIFYASNYLITAGGPVTVFWTLGVEEQFYLVLPFLVLACHRNAVLVACIFIAIGFLTRAMVLVTPISHWYFDVTILGELEVLGIGVLIGALTHTGYRLLGPRLTVSAITCFMFQGIAWYLWRNGAIQHLTYNLTTGVTFAWAVLLADRGGPGILEWFARFRLIRFIGKISYGIYLMHVFLLDIFRSQLVVEHFGHVPLVVQGIISLILSFVIPSISWIVMEAPILRLKDRLWNPHHGERSAPTRSVIAAAQTGD